MIAKGIIVISHRYAGWLLLALIVGLTWAIYLPGIRGSFLLDDITNLRGLQVIAAPLTWEQLLHYVISSGEISGPTLRPVSMMSFALQYDSWPNHPDRFKLVNICIHLANGVLVYAVAHKLAVILRQTEQKAILLSLLAAGFWLLHPINVSTVLYIVQRMAMLSAFFIMLGVWLYLNGRSLLCRGYTQLGWVLMWSALLMAGGLAVFSKESGALLPVFLLVLECSCLRLEGVPSGKSWQLWWRICLLLPTIGIVVYLICQGLSAGSSIRTFTVGERLLTEGRVLIEYLYKIFFPRPKAFGLYFDDFAKSTSLFSPVSTFWSLLVLSCLFTAACIWRNRWPIFSFAILWYIAGHLIESSTIQLELYFEHRNYVPLIGLSIAAPYIINIRFQRLFLQRVVNGVLLSMMAVTVLICYGEIQLWASPIRQALFWGQEKPDSLRARVAMAATFASVGETRRAYEEYLKISHHFGRSVGPLTDAMLLQCVDSTLPALDEIRFKQLLETSSFSYGPLNNFILAADAMENKSCRGLAPEYLAKHIEILLRNPVYENPHLRSVLLFTLARVYALDYNLGAAVGYAEMASEISNEPLIPIRQAEWLLDAGHVREALRKLEAAERMTKNKRLKQFLYGKMLARNKQAIINALAQHPELN